MRGARVRPAARPGFGLFPRFRRRRAGRVRAAIKLKRYPDSDTYRFDSPSRAPGAGSRVATTPHAGRRPSGCAGAGAAGGGPAARARRGCAGHVDPVPRGRRSYTSTRSTGRLRGLLSRQRDNRTTFESHACMGTTLIRLQFTFVGTQTAFTVLVKHASCECVRWRHLDAPDAADYAHR